MNIRLAVAIVATIWAGIQWMGPTDDTVGIDADMLTTTTGTVETSSSSPPASVPVVTVTAERVGVQHIVGTTTTPPTTVAAPIPGDCASWRRVFERRGAPPEALEFFFDDGIIMRETHCGLDNLNESTGDSGICQINPIHNRPGWFGGVEFGAGGWLGNLHGLTTRQNVDSVAWVDACVTLYAVCERGPWTPPYGCAGNPLKTDN